MNDPESVETVAMGAPRPASPRDIRFEPGTLLASRYRIISRLGKGGMGEVFRADDLILGQPVALKFLPESATGNLNLLKRFYDEVRIARQVSHANVCRVYDIGEVEGQPYLSMEYIDGEDLSSLLRRIGRLPADKAAEFARKMCAGLAAAHKQGVLHRDLKPGNIMIDARGEPRITDFGLAALAEGLEGAEIRNGTPAYMAPEQLEGREVSVQSDLYALGLVLYEMFTGKLPHQADTVAEIVRLRKESRVVNPSALVGEIDPAVERAIQRCLDPDPAQRPVSALALAASLPGGDPLAAALAAGETPSPEIVAASGSTESLSPKIGALVLAGVAVGLIVLLVLQSSLVEVGRLPLQNPPEVLIAQSQEILRRLGYTRRPADWDSGFRNESGYTPYFRERIKSSAEWNQVLSRPPSPINFWYREGPASLAAQDISSGGAVSPNDPPMIISGMLSVLVDLDGRLLRFAAIPPQQTTAGEQQVPVDWPSLFALAKLDPAQFEPDVSQWSPLAATDQRVAWIGTYPGTDLPVRIEGAAFQGKPIYFEILWPWATPGRMRQGPAGISQPLWQRLTNVGLLLLVISLPAGACWTARYNWKAGRGDVRGATRIGIYSGILSLLIWVLRAHHVNNIDAELGLMGAALGGALLIGAFFWTLYLALEPWVRRHWPQTLVTWSRILQGRWRDPIVGRDLLFAVPLGLAGSLLVNGFNAIEIRLRSGAPPASFNSASLSGFRGILRTFATGLENAIAISLIFLLALFFLRALLRKQWLAAAIFVLLGVLIQVRQSNMRWYLAVILFGVSYQLLVFAFLRLGLLATVVMIFVGNMTDSMITTDLTVWYGQSSWLSMAVIAALALWGFRIATQTAASGRASLNSLQSGVHP